MDIFNKYTKIALVIFVLFNLLGCASLKKSKTIKNKNIHGNNIINKKSKNFIPNHTKTVNLPPPPSPFSILSEVEQISPLETERISIHAVNAPLKQILYSIANDLGLNLIVSPDVDINQNITLNLEDVLAKNALDIIKDMAEVNYQVKGNILYINSIITKTFYIPYIQTLSGYNADLGGDVLGSVGMSGGGGGSVGSTGTGGGGGGSGNGALTGNFSLSYKKDSQESDFYTQLESNIEDLLSKNGKFVLNRSTGTLIITDKISNVKKVEEFLNKLRKELRKEVLIEAKVVEITLNKGYSYGINWSKVMSVLKSNITFRQNLAINNGAGEILITGASFNAILRALATAGKIETLSNPRIRVINGQSALISTGTVIPYWEKQINTTGNTGGGNQQEITYVRTSVLDGILLGVSAYINEDNTITINIIPVSTKIKGERQLVDNNQVVAQAPIIELKEAGTIIRVKDGTTIIIGGLISKDKQINEEKIPLLGDIPYLGALFKRKTVNYEKKELIIFLKPKIIRGIE